MQRQHDLPEEKLEYSCKFLNLFSLNKREVILIIN